jgi:peptidoglycan/LPS O-acetylase OafA/YrhL
MFCGAAAVTVFFVISGFVIHYPHKDKAALNIRSFLVRRWLRIGLPLLVVMIFAGFYHQQSRIPVWSLYCELIYYTIYPWLRKWDTGWSQKIRYSYILSGVLIACVAADEWLAGKHGHPAFCSGVIWYLVAAGISLPAWLLGVQLAERIDNVKPTPKRSYIYLLRIVVVLVAGICLVIKFQLHIKYLYTQILFALLAVHWVEQEIRYHQALPASRILEFCGRFSYSLYLCHELFVFVLQRTLPNNNIYWPLLIVAVLAMSYVFYLLVERPAHKLARYLAARVAENLKPA